MYHQPVMLKESIQGLNIKPNGIYVDATYGGGGHSAAILQGMPKGRLIAFDQDKDALVNRINDVRLTLVNHNFRYLKQFLKYYNSLPADGIIADLGVSSHQLDSKERGFSTRFGGDLDLRMNQNQKINAQYIVNEYNEEQLAFLFKNYGELSAYSAIAHEIVKERASNKIKLFEDLKRTIEHLAPKKEENKFFAQIMQALRIEVNQEIDSLKELLQQAVEVLRQGGRLVVISYHSLEDRIVKNFIKTGNFEGVVEKDFFGNKKLVFKSIISKPIIPSAEEIKLNSRSRSAKLRIAEKL
ncbi:MAG: 16S rRNA (cytosine(1402)-N(4))-methyltransferase RsmH [Bacteroidales bacterium]|jgi:16S rRNA (cytosine1402-N4)-methyltransferase|nr:16S rRNA (cytosine(1402)-N(4))-methyltransferase RsmH [Bacteroidales bacterium]MDI9593391.1 16S rRNA (cytosine(1402)-N(4))-methyltransferase RsmH [Bacteroidota bacterium]OQC36582.1 MAG: Ribosomal RNA small subunit methyltransferase H [Bacteroidetes bacterium ADurb.Bin041]HNV50652.1 16S rRNA (cytosine(1402)-N(4))-methyltransferase RsmH [Bacteroidales bacterium]HOF81462.1 16S rRNA (cytosine(1402)-N(4))-methyltransferase RsmH [Bacteroidales bacterium]